MTSVGDFSFLREKEAEERAVMCSSPSYSREVRRRINLDFTDPEWLPEYDEEECPECGGSGAACFSDDEGNDISRDEYRRRMAMTPEDRRAAGGAWELPCEECGGTGVVHVPIHYDPGGRRMN